MTSGDEAPGRIRDGSQHDGGRDGGSPAIIAIRRRRMLISINNTNDNDNDSNNNYSNDNSRDGGSPAIPKCPPLRSPTSEESLLWGKQSSDIYIYIYIYICMCYRYKCRERGIIHVYRLQIPIYIYIYIYIYIPARWLANHRTPVIKSCRSSQSSAPLI